MISEHPQKSKISGNSETTVSESLKTTEGGFQQFLP